MHFKRLVIALFVVILATSPTLSGCGRATPSLPSVDQGTSPTAQPASSPAPAQPTAPPTARPSPTATRSPLPPTVISISPARGEEQAPTADVTVTFDQAMDPASTAAAFSIEPKVRGEVKVQGARLTFSPGEPLKRGAEYRVGLAPTATSAAGLKLSSAVSYKFVTAGYLAVTSTQPMDKTADVPLDAGLVIAFNRPVVPLSLGQPAGTPARAGDIRLVITPTLEAKGEWLTTSIYQLKPSNGLAAATTYTVTVGAGLEDTTGGILAQPYTFTFRTTEPIVTSWRHEAPEQARANMQQSVPVETPITVTFSMAMDRASTEAAFSLVDERQTRVPGLFTWAKDDTELGFKPIQLLRFGTLYTATVAASAQPANRQGRLRQASMHPFTTVALPRVIRTDPRDGDSAVAPGGSVRFDFISPMVPSSFVTDTITVLPKPTAVYTSYDQWDSALYVSFAKLPATAYTVTLSGKVADRYGNLLGQDVTVRFTTRDYDPILQLNSPERVGTYNAYTVTEAVVTYRNVPGIQFDLYRTPVAEFVSLTGRDYWRAWDEYQPAAKDRLRSWVLETDAPRNRTAMARVPLATTDGAQLKPGIYYLVIAESGAAGKGKKPESGQRQLFARTDLNVTLKTTASQALAWVTDLRSGQPVPGATVRFTDGTDIDVSATTDADGIAEVALPKGRRTWDPLLALVTAAGDRFGVASSAWENGINPWDFRIQGGVSSGPYNGYVYTDRPIYRPGQTVYWKAIVRQDDDARYSLPPPGQPVTVTITDDQGRELVNQRMTLSATGSVDGSLALGPETSLGYHYLSVRIADAPLSLDGIPPGFGVGFQVAEYRKPEYEVSAATGQAEYIQGQQISVTVQANYFFGGPVKGGKVTWVLLSNDYSFYPKDAEGYSFNDWDWYAAGRPGEFGRPLSQGEGITDADGRFTFTAPADITRYPQSQRFTFDVSIQDVNNQVVSTQATAVVHKGDFYIGLRPQRYVAVVGEPSRVDVLTVAALPDNPPAPNTEVTLVVNRVQWYSVREQAEDGNYYWSSRAETTPVYTRTLTTGADARAVLEWTPSEGGQYKIEASGRDRAGHLVRSAAYVWASGKSYVNWRQENNDRIELIADRDEYKVGDIAEILVASPYQGPVKALLTVERDGILSRKTIEIEGNSQLLRIPIEKEHAPNIYVSLLMVKGMDATSPAPSFKMGLKQLKVSVADKELKVLLTPRGSTDLRFAPRSKVVWEVQTLDAEGRPAPAEVSLALIDKAVLSLAEDQAGKLMARFYSQRNIGVRTATTLVVNVDRLLAQLVEGAKGGGGGGGEAGAMTVRREFPDVAFWRATVMTDAGGKAEVEVSLPDNLTTWTMDARAVTLDTLVGQARADIIATKDLLVRPVLPRFFVVGDQADIAAVVHNNTAQALDVAIELKATGLKMPETTQRTVSIEAGGNTKIAWPVSVLSAADGEQIVVQMSALGSRPAESKATLTDAVEITLPVYRYTTPEVVGTSGQVGLGEGRLELVRLPAEADLTRGELQIRIEPGLAAGTVGGLTYLEHYPYECIEQTTSRFLPNVVTFGALKKLGITRPDLQAALPQQVGVGLQRIYAQQHLDGGWGWWPREASNPTISAYVVFGLAKARQAGFAVDAYVLDRGVRYLQRTLGAPAEKEPPKWLANQQAFTLYALAEAGAFEPNRGGALFEQREKLSLYAKAYLALALGLINDDASAARVKTLLADITGRAITSATTTHWEEEWTDYWNMNSDTRTTAVILDALARLDPGHSLGPNAVRWLMTARKADRWETTQENAWAIMALSDWMAATGELEGDYSWQVLLNDAVLGRGTVTPATVAQVTDLRADVAAAAGKPALLPDQTNGLTIRRDAGTGQTGKGQLYYAAYLRAYLPVEKVQPLNRGIAISRQYSLADCGLPVQPARGPATQCPPITQAKVGDVINVRLSIIVPNTVHFLIVEDSLPAGMEAINTSLRTTSVTARGPQMEKVQAGGEQTRWWWDWWWTPTHTDLRDEKVALFASDLTPGSYEFTYQVRASLPGRYLTLPATAYLMYAPEVWGRGAGGVFTVTE